VFGIETTRTKRRQWNERGALYWCPPSLYAEKIKDDYSDNKRTVWDLSMIRSNIVVRLSANSPLQIAEVHFVILAIGMLHGIVRGHIMCPLSLKDRGDWEKSRQSHGTADKLFESMMQNFGDKKLVMFERERLRRSFDFVDAEVERIQRML
jgi:hypothetical protein